MKPNHQVRPGWSIALLALSLVACDRASTSTTDAPKTQTRASDAFLVLPGDYAEQTTAADFQARFGKDQVRLTPGADQALILFPDDPLRRAYVDFHDDEKLEILSLIEVRDPGSLWRGKRGLQLGISLADLEKLNGKPFGYSGFDSQHRAWAHDQWSVARDDDDGQLGALDVEEGEHMYFSVGLGLRDPGVKLAPADLPRDEYLSSDDTRFPRVGELVIVTGFSANSSLDDEWQ